jgi:hypothetical protein
MMLFPVIGFCYGCASLKIRQGESMNEKPPATVEEALQGITAVRKPILPTLSLERLADLLPSAVVLVVVVAVVIGAAALVGKMFGGGVSSFLIR